MGEAQSAVFRISYLGDSRKGQIHFRALRELLFGHLADSACHGICTQQLEGKRARLNSARSTIISVSYRKREIQKHSCTMFD